MSATTTAPAVPSPLHLSKVQAAAVLGISVRSLDRLPLPKVKLLGRVMYRRDTLDQFSKANEK